MTPSSSHSPWNQGKLVGQIWAIRIRLEIAGQQRLAQDGISGRLRFTETSLIKMGSIASVCAPRTCKRQYKQRLKAIKLGRGLSLLASGEFAEFDLSEDFSDLLPAIPRLPKITGPLAPQYYNTSFQPLQSRFLALENMDCIFNEALIVVCAIRLAGLIGH